MPSTTNAFTFAIANDCPTGHIVSFVLTLTDEDFNSWEEELTVTVE